MALKEPSRYGLGGGRFQPRIGAKVSFRLKRWGNIFFLPSDDIRLCLVALRGVCCCHLDTMVDDTDR